MHTVARLAAVSAAFLTFISLPSVASATTPGQNRILSRYEVSGLDAATLRAVGTRFSIEGRRGDTFTVYVPLEQANELLAMAPAARRAMVDAGQQFAAARRDYRHVAAEVAVAYRRLLS